MNQTYPIWQDDKTIGQAQVSVQGLYYHIRCTCTCCCDSILRVNVQCGEYIADLGILVPENGAYIVNTRIAASKLGKGDLLFFIPARQSAPLQSGAPIIPEEPFAYIAKLESIRLQKDNGQMYAQIAELTS